MIASCRRAVLAITLALAAGAGAQQQPAAPASTPPPAPEISPDAPSNSSSLRTVVVPVDPQQTPPAPSGTLHTVIVPVDPSAPPAEPQTAPTAGASAPSQQPVLVVPAPKTPPQLGEPPGDAAGTPPSSSADANAPPPPVLETRPGPGLLPGPEAPSAQPSPETPEGAPAGAPAATVATDAPILDGHVRSGPFLSGPGSLTFVLHHTLLAAAGGLATQGVPTRFAFTQGNREAMLAGTLIGAGVGFGVSAYWQFTHWMGQPVATFGVIDSLIGGMAATGMMHLFTTDASVLTWTALIGAELGSWITTGVGGGEMTLGTGLAVSSGAAWATVYMAMLLGILSSSGSQVSLTNAVDALLIAPGIGASALALALLRIHPSDSQILRADVFGAGVGAAVFLISAVVLGGFQTPTPFVLGLLGSAGAITAVSIFWDERAEHHADWGPAERRQPYRNVWW